MNKARGCFISLVIFFLIALLIALIIVFPNLWRSFENNDSTEDVAEESATPVLQGFSFDLGSRNYLFLGIDEREGIKEFKGRTDTIMILQII
ncbi:MAG: hypothetical protein FJW66_09110 [Actinobacteria bacterium]|nr:hypothetical protein [Actinomycetota bacterium]